MPFITNPELDKYLKQLSDKKDPLLLKIEQYASENKIPILESTAAQLLEFLIHLYKPKRFLEIGTAIGYSTIRVAKILQNRSEINTIELSKDNIILAKSFFRQASISNSINLIEDDALNYLKKNQNFYDFIFLDADKEDYPKYLDLIVSRMLPEGILLVDNLLWKGYVASENVPIEYKKSTEFIKKFNAQFLNHRQLRSTILTVGDGLGLGIKLK